MSNNPEDEHQHRGIDHPNGRPMGEWLKSDEWRAKTAAYDRYIEDVEKIPGSFDTNALKVATPKQAAAAGLLSLMFGISERVWCSGWTLGLEDCLWCFREREPHADTDNADYLTERHRELLILLSDECDGWWTYIDGVGPSFLSLADWKSRNVR